MYTRSINTIGALSNRMFANTYISMLPLVSTFHQHGATFMGTPVLTGPKSLVTGMQHDTNFGIFLSPSGDP